MTIKNGTYTTTIKNGSDTIYTSDYMYTQNIGTKIFNTTITNTTKMTLPVFTPGTYTYGNICIGDAYTLCLQITRSSSSQNMYGLKNSQIESHMIKNSEWGAVTYLTHSQYSIGSNSPYKNTTNLDLGDGTGRVGVTGWYGAGANAAYNSAASSGLWYTSTGKRGSSNWQLTGVYDLNSCKPQWVAEYMASGSSNLSTYMGECRWIYTSFDPNYYKTYSTEYYTIYPCPSASANWVDCLKTYVNAKSTNYCYGDGFRELLTDMSYGNATVNSTLWRSIYLLQLLLSSFWY